MKGWAVAIKQADGTEVLWGSKDSLPLIWRGRYRKRAEKAAAFVWHSKPWRIVRVEYAEPRILP